MTPLVDPDLTLEQILAEHVVGPPETPPLHASGRCRHYGYRFTGLAGALRGDHGFPTCVAGRDNRAPGATAFCMPEPPAGGFPARQEFTEEERAAWRAYAGRSVKRSIVAASAIPREGSEGQVPCPACGTGTISWRRAAINRHLHAACSTPGCFARMS